jgi:hypothetical protein
MPAPPRLQIDGPVFKPLDWFAAVGKGVPETLAVATT